MTTSIEKKFTFKAGIHVDGKFQINVYDLRLYMLLYTENTREQIVAIERINYLIENCLDSCVFVNEKEKSILDKYLECNIRLCTLPEEPYDQIIMTCIMMKVNSICEGRITMEKIKMGSEISDYLYIVGDMAYVPEMFKTENWWTQPNRCISNYCFNKSKKGKIVPITSKALVEWDEHYAWDEITDKENSSEIMFINNIDQKH